MQCLVCSSFNEPGALYCSQCGRPLGEPARPRRRRPFVALTLSFLLLGLIAGVLYLASRPGGPGPGDLGAASSRQARPPRRGRRLAPRPAPPKAPRERETRTVEPPPAPPTPEELRARVEQAIVVLELRRGDDSPLREVRGVLVHSAGVVLTFFGPLLGAYGATCRLSDLRQSRVPVVGVSYYDLYSDLALVRVDLRGRPVDPLPLLDDDPVQTTAAGEPIGLFSGQRLREGVVAEPYFLTERGVAGLRLASDPEPPLEAFLAVSLAGHLIGLCRPVAGRRLLEDGEPPEGGELRLLVCPSYPVHAHLEAPAVTTLYELTLRLYVGSFADLASRAEAAYRRQAWEEAVSLFERARERAAAEGLEGWRLAGALGRLRESYLREIERLEGAGRLAEAIALAESALATFPQDPVLWRRLGAARLDAGLGRDAIAAFLELRAIEGSEGAEATLEAAYLKVAALARERNDAREAVQLYLEGLERLPASVEIRMELAKVYMGWEVYDQAAALLQEARALNPRVADEADLYLERIDDALKRRDAVVIPVPPGSRSIRAAVVVDGRAEVPVIIDTGATYTALSEHTVRSLGYDPLQGEVLTVSTAGGPLTVRRLVLGAVSLQGYTVRNLSVLVLPDGVGPASGLLGLNFLNHFKYGMDTGRGEFRLERP